MCKLAKAQCNVECGEPLKVVESKRFQEKEMKYHMLDSYWKRSGQQLMTRWSDFDNDADYTF